MGPVLGGAPFSLLSSAKVRILSQLCNTLLYVFQHIFLCFTAYFRAFPCGAASRPGDRGREGGSPLSAFVYLAPSRLFRTSTFFKLTKFSNSLYNCARLSLSSLSFLPLLALTSPTPCPISVRKKAALLPPFLISPSSPPPVLIWSACWLQRVKVLPPRTEPRHR